MQANVSRVIKSEKGSSIGVVANQGPGLLVASAVRDACR